MPAITVREIRSLFLLSSSVDIGTLCTWDRVERLDSGSAPAAEVVGREDATLGDLDNGLV